MVAALLDLKAASATHPNSICNTNRDHSMTTSNGSTNISEMMKQLIHLNSKLRNQLRYYDFNESKGVFFHRCIQAGLLGTRLF
jgi:hypothetical protein